MLETPLCDKTYYRPSSGKVERLDYFEGIPCYVFYILFMS
jgi:hypothetical protein